MKKILTVATLIVTALSAYSQTPIAKVSPPCTLKVSQAPAVRGIKLGMPAEDLLTLFPGSAGEDGIKASVSLADKYPNFGVVGMDIVPSRYSTRERYAGVGTFNFVLLDGRVAQYEVQYLSAPSGPTWRNIDDFIAKIADAFNVPAAKSWTAHQYNPTVKELKCDGFQLQASNVNLRGSLTVATFDAPFKTRQERMAAFEEKARREFRP